MGATLTSLPNIDVCNQAKNGNGLTPLLMASAQGHGPVVELLLVKGKADPNKANRPPISPSMHNT